MQTDGRIIGILDYETTLLEWEIPEPCILEMIQICVYKDKGTESLVLHQEYTNFLTKSCANIRNYSLNVFKSLEIFWFKTSFLHTCFSFIQERVYNNLDVAFKFAAQ